MAFKRTSKIERLEPHMMLHLLQPKCTYEYGDFVISKWIERDSIDGFVFNPDMEVNEDKIKFLISNSYCLEEKSSYWDEKCYRVNYEDDNDEDEEDNDAK